MSNEVVTFLSPRNPQEAFEIANNLSQSSMIPTGLKGKPADIVVAMAYGAELGLQPLQSLQNIAVINGRPSLWGDAMRALVLNSHDLVSLKEWNEGDVFYCEIVRKSRSGGQIVIQKSFSSADAQKAGLLGKQGPWKQYPDRMKQMRAFGFAARDAYADRLRGFITREEAEDIPTKELDITPHEQPEQQTGNAAIDSLLGEVDTEQAQELNQEQYNKLIDSIKSTTSLEMFASVMDKAKGAAVSELQSKELRKVATTQKNKLTQVDFN